VLQHRELERVGATRTTKVDIRVIAATHRDLSEMVSRGKFREDLWFRLNVFPIVIPPLRLRRDDVPALVRHFVEVKRRELGLASAPAIAPGALVRLQEYGWPGNVRELENVVERELIRSGKGQLRFDEIGAAPAPSAQAGVARRGPVRLDEAMATHIESVLATVGGKIHGPGGAAELLGVNENTLRNRMDRLRISYRRRGRAKRRDGS
jgi:hydrogenase-4 transcriptional activator